MKRAADSSPNPPLIPIQSRPAIPVRSATRERRKFGLSGQTVLRRERQNWRGGFNFSLCRCPMERWNYILGDWIFAGRLGLHGGHGRDMVGGKEGTKDPFGEGLYVTSLRGAGQLDDFHSGSEAATLIRRI